MRPFSIALAFCFALLAACNRPQSQTAQDQSAPQDQSTNVNTASNSAPADPASGGLAPASEAASYPSGDQSADQYGAPPPPPPGDYGDEYAQDASYQQTVQAQEAPPPLPEYEQPPCPGDGYIWTPGYWSYASDGYYWVPGAWVLAPYVGALWTPPWWGFANGAYDWHTGYWGPHIGFYGGVDYGFGYTGRGYYGAYWHGGVLDYNRSVTNVDTNVVHNVYNYSVPNNRGSRVSFNGGRGGINARPTPQELAVVHDPRTPPVSAQVQHAREASSNRAQFVKGANAKPASLVESRPLATDYKAPAPRPPAAAMRMAQRPAAAAPAPAGRPPARGPEQATRQPAQQPIPRPEARPEARPESRPAQQARPQPAPARPAAAPQARRVNPPAARPEPQARPEARPEARPTPAARPAPSSSPEARPEARPTPAARPAPQARPKLVRKPGQPLLRDRRHKRDLPRRLAQLPGAPSGATCRFASSCASSQAGA